MTGLVVSSACFYDPEGVEPAGTTAMVTTTSGESTSTGVDATDTGTSTGTPTTGPGAVCGDGIVEAPEACDDGNDVDADACTNTCTLATCGDGIVALGEACDDGNEVDDDACSDACVPASCGDGAVQTGEQCDEGGADTPNCDVDCSFPSCGDGHPNLAFGEACDAGGDAESCDEDCTEVACGDGHVNAAAGEGCEDGDLDGGDACSATCRPTVIVQIAMGHWHTCVRFASGAVRCWGSGDDGRLGSGATADLGDAPGELPVADVPVPDDVVDVCAGGRHTCVRTAQGDVHCWGRGGGGALGYEDEKSRGVAPGELPTPAVDVGFVVEELVCGGFTTHSYNCARDTSGAVRCWGSNSLAGLGHGNIDILGAMSGDMPPPSVPGISALALAGGLSHMCAGTGDGLLCWGANGSGQLGQGHTDKIGDGPGEMPPTPTPLPPGVVEVALGAIHSCARRQNGNVHCWGYGVNGRLGLGNSDTLGDAPGELPTPTVNIGGMAEQVVAGRNHTCVRLTTGAVKCWGINDAGQLGYASEEAVGDEPEDMPPPDVQLGGPAVQIAAHLGDSTCALLADGRLYCWGSNERGQLGLGSTASSLGKTPMELGPVPF